MDKNDIEIINIITDSVFEYAGKVFAGLSDLKKEALDNYKIRRQETGSPFVVLIDDKYPCFDFEDRMNENRYYQNYYFTTDRAKAERICEETEVLFRFNGGKVLYPVLEPQFSMSRIEEHHLPYIYYHGEGSTMQIVQNRKAPESEKIHLLE